MHAPQHDTNSHHPHRQPAAAGQRWWSSCWRRRRARRPRGARRRRRRGGRRRDRASSRPPASTSSTTASRAAPTTPCMSSTGSPASRASPTPPRGTGEPEFPELAQLLEQFASPFQHRPACSGPVAWKDFAAAEADIARAKAAMTKAGVDEAFMTSPSPGQIARYLKNQHYKTVDEYLFTLADVMAREYRAIVDAGFILQLDCPDLAMSYALYPGISIADYRKIIAIERRGAQSCGQGPAGRPHAHARVLGLDARPAPRRHAAQGHRRHHPQGASRRRCRFPAPIRVTATNGRCGRTSSCRTARSSFRA